MSTASRELVIDDQPYQIQFRGFDQPMIAQLESGASITLAPWPLGRHLRALDHCCALSPDGVALNGDCLAAEVLEFSGVPMQLQPPWQRLALWWAAAAGDSGFLDESMIQAGDASGGTTAAIPDPAFPASELVIPDPAGPAESGRTEAIATASGATVAPEGSSQPVAGEDLEVFLGEGRSARLRPWSSAERFAAVLASQPRSVTLADPAAVTPRLGGYLRAMLAASVELNGEDAEDSARLDAGAGARLLEATLRLNVLAATPNEAAMETSPMAVEGILRFCRALGWTPSQVWRTSAAELDRLSRLLDLEAAGRPAPPPPEPQGLARHPDAVLIQVENDDGDA